MSLYLMKNPLKEKVNLLIKLINLYIENKFTSDEIHHLLEIFIYTDISKDKSFVNSKIIEEIENIINIEFAFYTSNNEDLKEDKSLFWEDKLKILLINLKEKLIFKI